MATILVVDDDPTILKLCQTIFRMSGHTTLAAAGGYEAVGVLEAHAEIDLALIDVMMPGLNGVELAGRIKKEFSAVIVVLMSGYGPKEIGRILGDNRYPIIWKPFKSESLLRMIENALRDSSNAVVNP